MWIASLDKLYEHLFYFYYIVFLSGCQLKNELKKARCKRYKCISATRPYGLLLLRFEDSLRNRNLVPFWQCFKCCQIQSSSAGS